MNPSIDSLLFLSIYIRRIIQIIQIIAQRNIKIDSIKILENERKRERRNSCIDCKKASFILYSVRKLKPDQGEWRRSRVEGNRLQHMRLPNKHRSTRGELPNHHQSRISMLISSFVSSTSMHMLSNAILLPCNIMLTKARTATQCGFLLQSPSWISFFISA